MRFYSLTINKLVLLFESGGIIFPVELYIIYVVGIFKTIGILNTTKASLTSLNNYQDYRVS